MQAGRDATAGGERLATLASYRRYETAEAAVDALADRGFPVDRVAIVGRDLVLVERVTGRRTLLRSALDAGVSGAVLGAVLGWLLGLFGAVDPLVSTLVLAAYGAVLGAAVGAMVGAVTDVARRGRHGFGSHTRMEAERYELLVDEELRKEAQALLGELDARGGI